MNTLGLSITVLTAAALLALASCGGGGGDAGTNPGNDTTAPVTTLTEPASAAAGLTGTITLSATRDRQRRRHQRRVPGRRPAGRRRRHGGAVRVQRGHQRLCLGPARAARAGARRGGQPVGLGQRHGAVRRQPHAAGGLHAQRRAGSPA